MGSGCSVELAKQLDCQSCHACDEDVQLDANYVWAGCMSREEPLQNLPHPWHESEDAPTPRGPVPPWAVALSEGSLVDRTATGATPPKVLAPPRCSPPGLPEEYHQNPPTDEPSLLTLLGDGYSRAIFRAARMGDATLLEKLIADAQSAAPAPAAANKRQEQGEEVG